MEKQKTSARNQFIGEITAIKPGIAFNEVLIKVANGDIITATISHAMVEELKLTMSKQVIALIKASAVMISIPQQPALKVSTKNQLTGVVTAVKNGIVNAEVTVKTELGTLITAVITNESTTNLQLVEGSPAMVFFKASSVIVGVTR